MRNRLNFLCTAFLGLALTACLDSGGGSGLTVGLSSPAGTAYTNGTLNVQVTVSGGTPDSLELLRNNAPLATLSAPYSYTWETGTLAEGGYSLSARANKGGKIIQSEARTVFVDRTPPSVNLSSNTLTLSQSGRLELIAEPSDDRGLSRIEFLDGAQKVGEATSSPYKLSLNLESGDNREHTYTAKAFDRAGNSASSTGLKVTVFIPKRISENLIVNGDAEAGPASVTGAFVTDLPGWTDFVIPHRFTVVPYGASGFPSQSEGPANAGSNFFTGGPRIALPCFQTLPGCTSADAFSFALQTITLPTDWNGAVDAGTVKFELAGSFGGVGSLADVTLLSVTFRDAANASLGGRTVDAVSVADRAGKTGFQARSLSETMPKSTRKIEVVLQMLRTTAIYSVAWADNLSLLLKAY